ncbi:DMT family protein, partial [Xanthomonas campestris pv. campestris]|nr:DMT family protein [Xanthomonas campestris pv. campestris]
MPTAPFTAYLYPILLLLASNVFMTFAWYGHLKYKSTPLMIAILVSWGIAFFEYCLQVPGNRLGSAVYSAPQLKGMQEVITLLVFAGFSTFYLGQSLKSAEKPYTKESGWGLNLSYTHTSARQ